MEFEIKNGRYVKEYDYENGKVIYELNKGTGKIKEYDYHKGFLLYEGEYLNGRRNGLGKEYNENGELTYEGEYLNGMRNGKGKIYNYSSYKYYLQNEGEFVNGLKSGKGKEYNEDGNLEYKGEYLNGKSNGKGKEYFCHISVYIGEVKCEREFVNGKRTKGTEYDYAYYDNLKKYYNDILSKKLEKEREIEKAKKEKENEKNICFII